MWLGPHVATMLWLWCRLVAAALIQPLAWKLPYAAGTALKRKKKKKKKKKRRICAPEILHKTQIHTPVEIMNWSILFILTW